MKNLLFVFVLAASLPGDVTAQPESKRPHQPFRAFFWGNDPEHGTELWVTDGSSDGTRLALDYASGRQGVRCGDIFQLSNGGLGFVAGTQEGIAVVHLDTSLKITREYFPSEQSLLIDVEPVAVGTSVFWVRRSNESGSHELCVFRENETNERQIPIPKHFTISTIKCLDGKLNIQGHYYALNSPSIWRVYEIDPERSELQLIASWHEWSRELFCSVPNKVFYMGDGIWFSKKGHDNVPSLLKPRFVEDGRFNSRVATSEKVFFVGTHTELNKAETAWIDRFGTEVYVSDGTTEGTHLVKDINNEFGASSDPTGLARVPNTNTVAFFTRNPENIWVSDGRPDGTVVLSPIDPKQKIAFPPNDPQRRFHRFGQHLLFQDSEGYIWKTNGMPDGTARGGRTTLIESVLSDVGPYALFVAPNLTGQGTGIWATDGSDEGTFYIKDATISIPKFTRSN